MERNDVLGRIALATPEQRRELGLSLRDAAVLAGLRRIVVARVEQGMPVAPSELMRLAVAFTIAELYTAAPVDVRDVPASTMLELPRPVLARRPVPTLGGAA